MFKLLRSSLFAYCLVAGGAFILYTGQRADRLREHGKTARAEILKIEREERRRTRSYKAIIAFSTDDGREVRDTLGLTESQAADMSGASTRRYVDVIYLPESPTTFLEASRMTAPGVQRDVGVGFALAGIGLLVIRRLSRRH
ncbi:DUF3592 domain-containing protein [Uliginosibacterium sp. H1]|uniref:DUF3592 domain-containing protein n=1 Tax=Uliginosibacterium sp. H1 TaxID=3114757 RepID=UPI002E17E0C3|nr:DUF3592 domain-containing protein [Uliginosibacterium sp. H1]